MSSTLAVVVGIVSTIFVWALTRPKPGSREAKLMNEPDTEHIDIGEVAGRCRLADSGQFVVKTFRQSGNPHQEDRVFPSRQAALTAALATFRRAKIDLVNVMDSTEDEFSFRRSVRDHFGRNEGRKVRWIEIHRVP